ncbi:conserved hypothetical protein [Metallosphaera cuprina Ar-4]|uniref:Uncharacterized protein n=1 Tax=Metallosphaera cuprina (strain Ar-4) TaxID=1006006 RepID=F4G217_METCR|nr:conserved hypothetical protein [Metallosphaera cuprina Ar-4]
MLRELAEIESQKASLEFKLYQVEQSLKIETIRLMGQISMCEHYSPQEAKRLKSSAINYFKKYVIPD